MTRLTTEERFWAKVIQREDGCWEWLGAHAWTGYPRFWDEGHVYAHRYVYTLLVGPIPEGFDLDHLCRVRGCVNPDHLEAVTRRENLLRAPTFQAENAAKTTCPHGHPYDEANTHYAPSGARVCRECGRRHGRESMARHRARKKATS